MFEVVINGSLIVMQQCVGVPQTVTGLGLHRPILQQPGQLQGPPEGKTQWEEECQRMSWVGAWRAMVIWSFPPLLPLSLLLYVYQMLEKEFKALLNYRETISS